jgi:leucine efflux protein
MDTLASFGVINLAEFVIGTIAIVLLPGPNSLYILATSAKRGVKLGFLAAIGVLIGDTILMFAAAMGATAILKSFPLAYLTLRCLGAIYLAWIGGNLIWAGSQKWRQRHLKRRSDTEPLASGKNMKVSHPTKAALGLSLTNPKAIFFFISFFTQFVDEKAMAPGIAFLFLGLVLQLISFVYLSILIIAGAGLSKVFHERPLIASTGMILVAFLFLFFGVRLVLL